MKPFSHFWQRRARGESGLFQDDAAMHPALIVEAYQNTAPVRRSPENGSAHFQQWRQNVVKRGVKCQNDAVVSILGGLAPVSAGVALHIAAIINFHEEPVPHSRPISFLKVKRVFRDGNLASFLRKL